MHHLFKILIFLLTYTTLLDHPIICSAEVLNTEEAIIHMGYPLEKYKFHTLDKYILGMERIPHNKRNNRTIGKPVMLVHGMFFSSFILSYSNKSLSISLSEAGYDVWLFNARGTGLSRMYSIYPTTGLPLSMDKLSWKFGFHEIGVYDFTASIDFILNKTGHAKIDVVGYSLGATVALIGLAEKPEYNNKIDKLVLMAPSTRITKFSFPMNFFYLYSPVFKLLATKLDYFPPIRDPDVVRQFVKWTCSYSMFYPMCLTSINIAQGTLGFFKKDSVMNSLADFGQPMSTKMILHWYQIMSSGKFCHYDYGLVDNLKYYNRRTPPDYSLNKVTASTFIIHSKHDHLSPSKDVRWLITQLPHVKDVYYIDKIRMGHLAYVTHSNVEKLINSKIKNALSKNKFK